MVERGWGARIGALIRDLVEAIALAIVLFLGLRVAVQSTVVEGGSMLPNFVDGEWVLVNKLAYRLSDIERGDVVVFHSPGEPDKDYIKRVVGLPGDSVSVRDGVVFVDGQPLDEPWRPMYDPAAFGPYTVPPGRVLVFGDNRPSSNDSRAWSEPSLDTERIVGKVWLSIWPRTAWGRVTNDAPGPARGHP